MCICRRYAEFVSSVLALTRGSDSFGIGGGGEHMLIQDLQQMRIEIVGECVTWRHEKKRRICAVATVLSYMAKGQVLWY